MKNATTRKYYIATLLATVYYVIMTFSTPVRENTFKLSDKQLFNLRLTVVIPVVLIWLIGTYGVAKFKSYAASIKDSPDGKGFNTIANGLAFLLYGGLVTSLYSVTIGYWATSASIATRTRISNAYAIIVPLIAYFIILKGARMLVKTVHAKSDFISRLGWSACVFLVIATTYAWMTITHLPEGGGTFTKRPFYLSNIWVIFLVVLPYILTWGIGVTALTAIQTYAAKVKGSLYRQALHLFVFGVYGIIALSMSLQFMASANIAFQSWGLQSILRLIYAILVLYALGYILVGLGARKLQKIEDAVGEEAN